MENLYETLKQTSARNTEKRIHKEKDDYKKSIEELKSSIQEMKKTVLENNIEKMKAASENGYNHCELYTYEISDKLNDTHKINFLFRGPMYDNGNGKGVNFFQNKGIKSLLEEITDDLSPFRVGLRFNRLKRTNTVVIYW
mgnify:CR=1 FL=1